jgi:hypothetical protein
MILPGVCSQKTTDMMHLMACIVQPMLEVIGTRDNKPRAEMDAIAARVGLDFVINTVMDEDKNMLGVFAGHFVDAHRAACEMAERVMVIPTPAQADILIVSANPCHFDYWQGIKPYAYCHRAVREGGIIIFMLDGTEGLCGDAPSHEDTVRKYLPWSFDDQKAAVDRGEVEDLVGLNVPMYHATVRHRVERTILVTNHLGQRHIDALKFDTAPSVLAALEVAYGILGRLTRVGVIPFGGETLVRVAANKVQIRWIPYQGSCRCPTNAPPNPTSSSFSPTSSAGPPRIAEPCRPRIAPRGRDRDAPAPRPPHGPSRRGGAGHRACATTTQRPAAPTPRGGEQLVSSLVQSTEVKP